MSGLILTIIAAVLTGYLILCLLRIFSSWFGNIGDGSAIRLLAAVTDPWLNLFKGIKFLRLSYLDLTPLVALVVLQLITQVFWELAYNGSLTLGHILNVAIRLGASAIGFMFIFFIVLTGIRLLGVLLHQSSVQRFWFTLDHILQPLVYPLASWFSPRKPLPYGTTLAIFMLVAIVLHIAIQAGLGWLAIIVRPLGSA